MALRLHNIRLYPLIFLIGIAAVIVAWSKVPAVHKPELLVSGIGGIAGFTYFLYRQHLDEAKLFKDLFTDFNARYDALNDHLNAILFRPHEGALSAEEKDHLFSYFNICAEEYLFYKAGYIDRSVWESWYRGMGVFFKNPLIWELWEQESVADSFYGFRPPQSAKIT